MGGYAGGDPAILLHGRKGASSNAVGYDVAHLFLQQWYGYSDPGMEDALHDNVAVRVFAGVDAGEAPDETTICKFRHLLEQHGLTRQLFELSRDMLETRGLLLKEGTIVDASIISEPSSTKNQSKQRDPEMKSTKKGNQWYFGMKAHIGTDTQGLGHSVAVTPANAHDITQMDECLHGQEKVIYGDKTYVSERYKRRHGMWNGVYCARQRNHESSTVRTSPSTRRATESGPELSIPSE